MSDIHSTTLQQPDRLAILHDLQVYDHPLSPSLDSLTTLATRLLDTSAALVSIVDADRQIFLSCVGMREPWATLRQTPLSHSFCQYVVTTRQPLVIGDAQFHPLLRDNLAISELGVVAYAGIPLMLSSGYVLGAFAAVDDKARDWSATDLALLHQFAAMIITELERRQAEAQVVRLRAELAHSYRTQRVLSAGIAHHFNNLLGGILGNAELALSDLPPASRAEASIVPIIDLTHRAAQLTRQMLTYTGDRAAAHGALDLGEVVRKVIAQFVQTLPSHTTLRDDLAPQLPPILGDPEQFAEMLGYILINAAEALGERGGEIALSVSAAPHGCDARADCRATLDATAGGYVVVVIRDTGIGMDAATCARVFEPFFSTKLAGGGLGLSAAYGIVQNHQGTISVTSAPERGTSVTCVFPAIRELAAAERALSPSTLQRASSCLAE